MPDTTRSINTDNLDARKRRSRAAIHSAFLRLLEQKPLEHIAIREIATEANVGHATFYRHYPTKDALLNDLAADEIRQMVKLSLPVLDACDSYAACLTHCRYVDEHRRLWTTLLTGGAAGALKEELLDISRRLAAERGPVDGGPLPTSLSVVLIVSSIMESLSWWLRNPDRASVEEMAGILDHIITKLTATPP